MFKDNKAFSGFSVDDLQKAKEFYGQTLGLTVNDHGDMGIALQLATGGEVFIYPKPNHEPATFTVLNFRVDDIDAAAAELLKQGVQFEHYEGMHQDETGVAHAQAPTDGPSIAWFKDPAGNILSILQPQEADQSNA